MTPTPEAELITTGLTATAGVAGWVTAILALLVLSYLPVLWHRWRGTIQWAAHITESRESARRLRYLDTPRLGGHRHGPTH